MSQREENDLIAEALKARTEASRKLKLLDDHLARLGNRLKQIGNDLSPQDGSRPNWEAVDANLAMTHSNRDAVGFLDIDKVRLLIGERAQLARTVEEKSDTLRKYGAE